MGRRRFASICCLPLVPTGPLPFGVGAAQPAQGTRVVSGTQVVQNESAALNGNPTVRSGGNLTLGDDSLMPTPQYNGQYGISVE